MISLLDDKNRKGSRVAALFHQIDFSTD